MNPFSIVKDSMEPTTTDQWFVWALIDLASVSYSSGWSPGQSKRTYVKDYFKSRYGKESPVYTKLATMLGN